MPLIEVKWFFSDFQINLLLQKPDLYLFDNLSHLSEAFLGNEKILLDLLSFKHISTVVKANIMKTLLTLDLNGEMLNGIIDIIFKCQDTNVALLYLPIISKHIHKISKERHEILCLCYFNHARRPESAHLNKASRVALMNFFIKTIMTLGPRIYHHQ